MASVSSPYGVQIISDNTGTPRTERMPFGIVSGYASNIFKFQPFKLVAGLMQPITASSDKIYGIFAGAEFTPLGGRPAVSPFWPGGTTYDAGYDTFFYYWPAWLPGLRFRIQADGSVAQASMGKQFNISNFAAGNTSLGLSTCTVAATPVTTGSQGQFALTEFDTGVLDAGEPSGGVFGGDAFTDCIFTIANPQVGPAPQVGI